MNLNAINHSNPYSLGFGLDDAPEYVPFEASDACEFHGLKPILTQLERTGTVEFVAVKLDGAIHIAEASAVSRKYHRAGDDEPEGTVWRTGGYSQAIAQAVRGFAYSRLILAEGLTIRATLKAGSVTFQVAKPIVSKVATA